MKKIRMTLIFITLLILLAGFVNASEVPEDITDTDIISEELAVKDTDAVSNTDALLNKEAKTDLQADDEYESMEKSLKMNRDKDELKEGSEITDWSQLAKAVTDTKGKKGEITLTLGKGTYKTSGTITFNNPNAVITINGNGQKIDGNKQQLFSIRKGASVVLSNITINNGFSWFGGAIANHGTLTITQSTFTKNTVDTLTGMGGAIFNDGKLTITQSTFTDNQAVLGGSIFNNYTGNVNITQSTFTGNSGKSSVGGGDGGAITNDGTLTITKSTFTKNTGFTGGAIENDDGKLTITESTFSNNKASYQGGAIFTYTAKVNIAGSNFTSNRAQKGAAISAYGGTNITGNRFTDNHASENKETIELNRNNKGVFNANAYKSTDISLKTIKLELKDNKNTYYSGEEVALKFNIGLEHPNFYDKDVLKRLEDITLYVNGVKYLTAKYPDCTLNLKAGEYEVYYKTCQHTSNTVKFTVKPITNWQQLADAVDYAKNQTKDISIALGEGTFINTGTINWTNRNIVLTIDGKGQTIDGNQKQVFYNEGGATMVLNNITIQNAKSEDGAIYSHGVLKVVGATLINNTATQDGGAISCYGTLTVINSTLINNTAAQDGGAIKSGYTHADIINSNFTNNHAAVGGAIFSYGNCNITGNIFANNTADNRETIDLYGHWNGNVNSNTYESTDISLKTIDLKTKDNQTIFNPDEEVVLNFTIALTSPNYYDKDILERFGDITIYINGMENATSKYENYTLSNLMPGEYTVYYEIYGQKSNTISFEIIDVDKMKLTTWDIEMVKGRTATFSAVIDYKNTTINYGNVYFEIDGKPLADEKGLIQYAPVKNNRADLSCKMPINLPLGNHRLTAVYVYDNRTLATDNKTLAMIENIPEKSGDKEEIQYEDDRKQETFENGMSQNKYMKTTLSSLSNHSPVKNTCTVTRISDNHLISKSNLFILEYLNKLFNMTFINGHIKVYIDGKLVFEGDTSDDLTQVIFEIRDEYLGEHEITVEFTDSAGKTNNYKEKIIVE